MVQGMETNHSNSTTTESSNMNTTFRNNIARILSSELHCVSVESFRAATLSKMTSAGLVEVDGGSVVITDAGYLAHDPSLDNDRPIVADFLRWAQPSRDRSFWSGGWSSETRTRLALNP